MSQKFSHLKLKILKEEFEYTLFDTNFDMHVIADIATKCVSPIAIFKSENELSVIAKVGTFSEVQTVKSENGWLCIKIVGSMPFGSVQGLISNISNILIQNEIGICVVSTYMTDWFLIREKYKVKAISALTESGWLFDSE